MENLILVVDDEKPIVEILKVNLVKSGYRVIEAYDGNEAVVKAIAEDPDLILLDVAMPEMDGFEFCEIIKNDVKTRNIPIVFISAFDEPEDIVKGFEMGGADYVTKPFMPLELMARVNSQLRRYLRFSNKNGADVKAERVYTIGGLELNEDTVEFSVDGNPVKLTPIEFKILALLMRNAGRVVTKTMIMEHVWEYNFDPQTNIVETRLCRLREKIEDDPANPTRILTRRGVGYYFNVEG